MKLLLWESDGFSIYFKRLERGTYELPVINNNQVHCVELRSEELMLILQGIVLQSVRRRKRFTLHAPDQCEGVPVAKNFTTNHAAA